MKGDMYDDGTPNPLVVKCPNCGGETITEYIGTGSVKYRCNACGKEFSNTHITDSVAFRSCPNCGAQMSYDYIRGMWYCTSCGCTAKDSIGMSDKTEATQPTGAGSQTITTQPMEQNKIGLTGWICPVCGAGVSPYANVCPNCSGNKKVTVDDLDPFKYYKEQFHIRI